MYTQTNRQGRGGGGFGRRRTSSSKSSHSRGKQTSRTSRSHASSRFSSTRSGRNSNSGGGRRSSRKLPSFNPAQFINTNPVEATLERFTPVHNFATFGLSDALVRAIAALGITEPSPIQDQIIPLILEGKDVIGLAETGTGKTAAFLIPLINKTLTADKRENRQTLILTPTRELAIQVEAELKLLARGNKIYSVTCVGGTGIRPQIQALRRQNHFVIGTPGRILDLINRKHFKTEHVTTVVLDEADRMLDMGFIGDIRKILSTVPEKRETLLFSATINDATKKIVNDFLKDPVLISVKKKDVINSIEQNVVQYTDANKFETLTSLLNTAPFTRVIVFGSMKRSVEKLAQQLSNSGIKAESIHGNKSHGQRQRSLKNFKDGGARVLVATDVAARGIHVDDVSHVINYDLPNTFEDYVHRIGRTGRANKFGAALTFVPAHN